MDHDLLRRRDDLARDLHWRREPMRLPRALARPVSSSAQSCFSSWASCISARPQPSARMSRPGIAWKLQRP